MSPAPAAGPERRGSLVEQPLSSTWKNAGEARGSSLWERHPLVLITFIMLAGLALRLVQIDREALWADETLTLLIANWPARSLLFDPVEASPAVYYLLTKWLIPADAGVAAVRLIAVTAGTASIAVVYGLGRMAFSPRAGLWAAALMALSPVMVDYSQEGRPYAVLVLLVLLSALGLVWWIGEARRARRSVAALCLFATATVLAFYTHFTSIFWIIPAVIAGYALTRGQGNSFHHRAYLLAAAAMAAAASPEVVRIYERATLFGGFSWLANPGVKEMLATSGDAMLPTGLWNGREGAGSAASVFGLFLALGVAAWRLHAHRQALRLLVARNPAGVAVTGILLAVPLLVWIFGFVVTPIWMPRSIMLAAPGFAMLAALVVSLEGRALLGTALVGLYAANLAVTGTVRPKEPWMPVANHIRQSAQPGDGILVCPEWRGPSLMHAMGGRSDLPVYLMFGGEVLPMPPVAAGQNWPRAYFSVINKPLVERFAYGTRPKLDRRQGAVPSRLWVIESGCTPTQQVALRNWLGSGRKTPVFARAATVHFEGMRLSLFEGRAGQREVLFVGAGER